MREYWPFLLIVLATFATLSWSQVPVRPRDLILLLVSLYASLASIRLIPLFVLIAVPAHLPSAWQLASDGWPSATSSARISTWLNAAILLAMAVFASIHIAQVIQRQPQAEAELFPSGAVAFLQHHPPSGPIFNHYDWGGYLIWKLYPSTPVFIDGRADLYGQQLFHDFADAYQFKGRWQQILQRWHIQTVIVPPNSALATGLQSAPGWIVSYRGFPGHHPYDAASRIGPASPFPLHSATARRSAMTRAEARTAGYSRYAINCIPWLLWRVLWFIFWTILRQDKQETNGMIVPSGGQRRLSASMPLENCVVSFKEATTYAPSLQTLARRRRTGHCGIRRNARRHSGNRCRHHSTDWLECQQCFLERRQLDPVRFCSAQ